MNARYQSWLIRMKHLFSCRWMVVVGLVLTFVVPSWPGETAMMLSFRGVRAYEAGHYALAQSFFERSAREALLKGEKEHAIMATANWVDVLLETGQLEKAQIVLNSLGEVPDSLQALVHWKQGQVYLALDHPGQALDAFDSTQANHPPTEWSRRLKMDRTRAEWLVGDTLGSEKTAASMVNSAPVALLPGWQSLWADILLARGQYAQSDSLLDLALKGYRERHRYARTVVLLGKQAVCASARGQRERSLRLLKDALTIASELGINPDGLEKSLVRLIPLRQEMDIAKSPIESDLDWQGKTRDAIGELKPEPQNANEKSVSLPLDGANPQ